MARQNLVTQLLEVERPMRECSIREGEACVTRTLLGDLLGREPESFDRTIFEMAKVSS